VFPDYNAPIVRNGAEGRELATARWGMPSSSKALMDATKKRAEKLQAKGKTVDFKELLRMEPDGGTTNIRNVKRKHWARWLGPEHRCVVPFNSFSEFKKPEGGDIWFALDETRPLACFAGIWTNWTSVRKVKEGETTNDLYAFLTTEPSAEVGAIHPKAMPVILTTPDEVETWMTAPPDEALKLQRPLPDGSLRIVRPWRQGRSGRAGGVTGKPTTWRAAVSGKIDQATSPTDRQLLFDFRNRLFFSVAHFAWAFTSAAICRLRFILESFDADDARRLRLTFFSANAASTGGRSPSSQSCSSAKARQAASIRLYRL